MKKSLLIRSVWLIFFLLASATLAQPEDPREVMTEGYELFFNGRPTEALQIFEDIAQGHRGTEVGREALQFLAANVAGSPVVYLQQIISDFPNTDHETRARIGLLGYDFEQDPDKAAYLQGCNALVRELGGPSLEEIISSGESPALANQIRELGPDKQRRLLIIYTSMGGIVGSRFPAFISGDVADHEGQSKMLRFLHRTFSPLNLGYNGLRPIFRSLPPEAINQILESEPSFINPTVSFESPSPGSTTGPQPTIKARITVGDITIPQVSLEGLEANLDGTDVKGSVDFQTTFGDPRPGVVYLTIDVTLQPAVPLASGPHQFVLEVPVEGYSGQGPGKTVATLDFFVADEPQPSTETLPATKDALVYEKSPHSNEGANPRLTLEKINGKTARNLLGFDLSGVNTNSLTSATLVLSIDSSDQVTGWGNGETVTVKPVTVAWQEGNGKKYGLPTSQQSAGSGAGTTWFSPTDENISNDSSNGVVQWSGGAVYATTGTAPPLTVHNHQTGELRFDVTQDVLNGVTHGWLLRKDAENKGSKVSFYSREAGANVGPRLILEFGGTAVEDSGFREVALGRRNLFETLANLGARVGAGLASSSPFLQLGQVAYSSWILAIDDESWSRQRPLSSLVWTRG